jgi:signal transduction histidine kinase
MDDRFGLSEPSSIMGMEELWERVQEAFGRIVQALPLASAVLFHSNQRDFLHLDLRAFYSPNAKPPELFSFTSYQEFEWLEIEGWVNLPTKAIQLSWIRSETLLGVNRGVLMGRELAGHLTMLGFGLKTKRLLKVERRGLQDAAARLFRFLATGLVAAELDHLMAETGHLMGRAMGKVISGVQALKSTLAIPPAKSGDSELFRLALWAIEDGQSRLELIRQNFYSFQARRLHGAGFGAHFFSEIFDARREVELMKPFFDRSVAESGLKPMVWDLKNDDALLVLGDRDAFRLMLLNIFDNALKFSYQGTYISMAVESSGLYCRITCSNLGIGVARDEVYRVFQPFFKSRYRDPLRGTEGLGLGLAYCRWVAVEVFDGNINLTSSEVRVSRLRRFEGDNWITTIIVALPLRVAEKSDVNSDDK